MKEKNVLLRVLPVLALLMVFVLAAPAGTAKAAKAKKDFFSYRVDVLDATVGDKTENLAVEVCASVDGTVYIYAAKAGTEKYSTAASVKNVGLEADIPAGEEQLVYGQIDWLEKWKLGEKYDVFIAFEDVNGGLYGPYKTSFVAKYFPAGTGTAKDPYQIWTDTHLANVRMAEKGEYFKLMQDLNMTGSRYTFRVCGSYGSSFEGTFDGDRHTITGLEGRLFNNIEKGAVVKNLFLNGANGTEGGIISETNKGTISNCAVVNSSLANPSTSDTGFMTGYNLGTIENCKAENSMIDGNYAELGGIAGRNDGLIDNCYSKVRITDCSGKKAEVGGIAGSCNSKNAVVRNCYYEPMSGNPFTGSNCGGIVGYLSSGTVTKCRSDYLPKDLNKYPGDASVIGYLKEYFESDNYGATKEDPQAPDPENEKELAKYENLLTVWKCYQGLQLEDGMKAPADPISGKVATSTLKATGFKGTKIKMKSILPNETKEYNNKFKAENKSFKKVTVKNAPKAVKLNSAKKSGTKDIVLSFSKASGASGYSIYVSTFKYGLYTKYKQDTNTNSYTDKYLDLGNTYYYRVRPYKVVNGKKVYGAFSNIVSCKMN